MIKRMPVLTSHQFVNKYRKKIGWVSSRYSKVRATRTKVMKVLMKGKRREMRR